LCWLSFERFQIYAIEKVLEECGLDDPENDLIGDD
jgi:hypothetical protein